KRETEVKRLLLWACAFGAAASLGGLASVAAARSSNGAVTAVRAAAPPPPTCSQSAELASHTFPRVDGNSVSVWLTVAAGCENAEFSLVTYESPTDVYSPSMADQEVLYRADDQVHGPGTYQLKADLPSCYYQ